MTGMQCNSSGAVHQRVGLGRTPIMGEFDHGIGDLVAIAKREYHNLISACAFR
jgi:hypothetical protein